MKTGIGEWLSVNWRLYLVYAAMAACVVTIGWKVSSLQIRERDFLQGQGDARTIRSEPIIAHRGIITDRNGEPLAVSTPVKSIWVNPKEIGRDPAAIATLAAKLDMDAAELGASIGNNAAREFLYVKRRLPPALVDQVLALRLAGVYAQQEFQRYYPQGEVTAHLVGFNNVDDVGQEGLELTYEEWLRGIPGKRQVMKDRRGHIIEELNVVETAQPGQDLQLSIDFRIQNLAYKELKAEYITRRAESASVVVMDVATGEILALASQPSYNPNNRGNLSDFSVMRNRAVADVFEPGSTAKAFTIAAALESGKYHPDTLIETRGWMMVDGKEIKDSANYGTMTVEKIITKSSNVGATKIALDIGPEPIRNVMERVGLGLDTGTGFPGERTGILPSHRRWSRIETATLSYGYGLSVTALQLVRAYGVIASGGLLRPVSLVRQDPDSIPAERVLSKEISDQVLTMLRTVVDARQGGTAVEANVPFYTVAGKTGTARVVGEFGYDADRHNSLFIGMAPAVNPKIVVLVIVNEPKGSEQYGGQVSAPVFSRIVTGAMRILDVPPDKLNAAQLVSLGSS